ncbi:MAG: hypothetical protein K9J47_06355 [Sulfuritalea sp.]|jgi:hypothetical protein|nr:hypothetical protein [Polynucleobacter sp.]MCF8188380.1 hypothetical protein [Sulfuritalea sp.]
MTLRWKRIANQPTPRSMHSDNHAVAIRVEVTSKRGWSVIKTGKYECLNESSRKIQSQLSVVASHD